MNDFTKEELENLLNYMAIGANWKTELSTKDSDLMIKLESMIDNYHNKNRQKLIDYVSQMVIEKHKTCLTNEFDNGYFWAMKDLQILILKGD